MNDAAEFWALRCWACNEPFSDRELAAAYVTEMADEETRYEHHECAFQPYGEVE